MKLEGSQRIAESVTPPLVQEENLACTAFLEWVKSIGYEESKSDRITEQIQEDIKLIPEDQKGELRERILRFFEKEEILFPEEELEVWIEVAMSVYASSREMYAPIVESWVQSLMDRAVKDDKTLVFLARDGLAPYLVAQKIQQSSRKYADVKMHYAYISRNVVFDAEDRIVDDVPLLHKYIQQLGVEKGEDCLMVDIGFSGTMIPFIKKQLQSLTKNIEFEFLISKTPNATGHLGDVDHPLMALNKVGGNSATHWMEDVHQGVIESPSRLVETAEGLILPNVLAGTEPVTCKETRPIDFILKTWGLQGVLDGAECNPKAESMETTAAKTKEVFDQFLQKYETRQRFHLMKHGLSDADRKEIAATKIQRFFRNAQAVRKLNAVSKTSLAERRDLIDQSVVRSKRYRAVIAEDPVQPLQNPKMEMLLGLSMDQAYLTFSRLAQLISYEKFVTQLKRSFKDTLGDVLSSPEGERSYVIIADQEGKSANWVIAHLHEFMAVHPPENIIPRNELEDYLKRKPEIKHIVMIDDAVYSGEQASGYISELNDFFPMLNSRKFHVSIPFMTQYGKNNVRDQLVEKLHLEGCLPEEFEQHYRFADHFPLFTVDDWNNMGFFSYRELMRPDIRQLLNLEEIVTTDSDLADRVKGINLLIRELKRDLFKLDRDEYDGLTAKIIRIIEELLGCSGSQEERIPLQKNLREELLQRLKIVLASQKFISRMASADDSWNWSIYCSTLTDEVDLDRALVEMAHKSPDKYSVDVSAMRMILGEEAVVEPYKPERKRERNLQIQSLMVRGYDKLEDQGVRFIQSNRGGFIIGPQGRPVQLRVNGVSIALGGNEVQQWKLEEGQIIEIEDSLKTSEWKYERENLLLVGERRCENREFINRLLKDAFRMLCAEDGYTFPSFQKVIRCMAIVKSDATAALAESVSDPFQRRQVNFAVIVDKAIEDLEGTLETVSRNESIAQRDKMYYVIASKMIKRDIKSALEIAGKIDDINFKDKSLTEIAIVMAKSDPDGACQLADRVSNVQLMIQIHNAVKINRELNRVLAMLPENLAGAWEFVGERKNPEIRSLMYAAIAKELLKTDVDTARRILIHIENEEQWSDVVAKIVKQLAKEDLSSALMMIETIRERKYYEKALQSAILVMAETNVENAYYYAKKTIKTESFLAETLAKIAVQIHSQEDAN